MMTSFLIPARAMLSPISMKARSAVSGESVSVPGNALCSSDAPTACTGVATYLTAPYLGVNLLDASNDGWGGDVLVDNISVAAP